MGNPEILWFQVSLLLTSPIFLGGPEESKNRQVATAIGTAGSRALLKKLHGWSVDPLDPLDHGGPTGPGAEDDGGRRGGLGNVTRWEV